MKKTVFIKSMLIVGMNLLSFNVIACGGDVDMTVPHIHDENGMLVAIEQTKNNSLKHINIYQIFAGELASKTLIHSHSDEGIFHDHENEAEVMFH
ncbi:hypothetical protein [Aliivibrio sp. 1S128]|uniref:hypothetical protein n=1 Tax=Aliivibrio sp. 1S128 TaxID=1840085 RepID=UPI00080DE624|nr:hypothetical protein [Aliivibrio sp. 1S128]OCH15643.1 hypothetical protein A6E03_03025 [Aliivibrio sp. 1S128]